MAASENTLNQIHEFFANYILGMLSPDYEGNPPMLTAAEMGVVAKFLKDNNISFAGGDDDSEEIEEMRKRAKEAALNSGFTKTDIEEAVEGLDFRTH